MRIGVIGAGRIGGNAARLLAKAGHEVLVSFSRDQRKLEALAAEIGGRAGTPREAVQFAEVVMLSVSWTVIDDVVAQAGPFDGKVVIDTTNQFGREGWEDLGGRTAAQVNAARLPGARYTKAFNTLTSGFQAEAAGRTGPDRVVMFLCGDDEEAKRIVSGLIDDASRRSTWAPSPMRRRWRPPGARVPSTARRSTSRRRGTSSAQVARDTLYDWAGGADALDRLTQCFYRRVHDDPILSPVFAGMSPEHPHHVALWLGEVFGGPPVYTEEHGGYPHMMSRHLGLALTEEQRARWVALVTPAADDADLPADPEFRSALLAYVEWGTRIALANSQPGATPPPEAPVPHRGWARRPVSAVSCDGRCRSAPSRWSATSPSTSSPPSSFCAPPTSRPTPCPSCSRWPTTRRARCGTT